MNLSKARDFYSAYYEGTLDEGLRQAFERAMAADAQVGAEYRQFVRIMEELKSLQTPVEVPADLHIKIRDRVDAHILAIERSQRAANRFFAWRPIAYGAVATLAIIAAFASISTISDRSDTATAGMAPSVDRAPTIVYVDGQTRIKFASARANGVTVTSVPDGRVVASLSLAGQALDCPLTNTAEDPAVVSVSFVSKYPTLYVAVPGTRPDVGAEGSGTVLDLAAAIAARYSVPVVLQTASPALRASWQFDGTDVLTTVSDEMKQIGLRAEVRESGVVWISSD